MANIFYGKTNHDCVNSLINKLKQNYVKDSNSKHYFIVPDRISVLTEVKIFNALNIESTCNIEVLTLSRLASRLMQDVDVISKTSSCMIFQKLLKDNRQNLKCFNKNINSDLATTLFETVSQFKSCKVEPENIVVKTQNKILSDKLSDIALIYSAYQKHLKQNGLYDGLDRLNFVEDKIIDNQDIKNSYVYVGNFDSFTFQGLQIIAGLLRTAKEFNIGLTFTDNLLNSHIYLPDLNENILSICRAFNIEPNIFACPESLTGQFKYLQDNLFSYNNYPLKLKTSNISLFEGKTFEEEVLFCASTIKDLIVFNNYKFNDFVVAVPNLKDKQEVIANIFNSYNFNYYIDATKDFKSSILVKFIEDLTFVLLENFSQVSCLSLIKNPLLNIDYKKIESCEDYIKKFNINDFHTLKNIQIVDDSYNDFNEVRNFVLSLFKEFLQNIKDAKTYGNFLDAYENLLIKCEISQKLVSLANEYTLKNLTLQAKLFEQYYNTLQEVFSDLRECLQYEECDLKLFYSTLISGINNVKISTTPLFTSSLFVGDTSTSFFDKAKVYFVLGADEKNFPKTLNDCGIISDKEIFELSESYKLEPSIATINAKERFKTFEMLLNPTDKLFLSYNYEVANTQKSKILSDISKMFVLEDNFGKFNCLPFRNYDQLKFLTKNNNYLTAKNNSVQNIRNFFDGQHSKIDINLLNAVNKTKDSINLNLFNYNNKLNLKTNIFFNSSTVSVSQIESFMLCPFVHFARYGLKINEADKGELNALNIGTILHDVARQFVQQNNLPVDDKLVEGLATKAFNFVIEKEVFDSVKNNNLNKVLIKNLLKEAVRFCGVLNYQAKYSSFKPIATEMRFDDKNLVKSFKFKIGNRVLKLVGQVDRIDKFEDYFRIIDYKTGKCDTSLKELFFGKKVQLEAYVKVVEDSLKLKPAGAYYLPVKASFADENTTLQAKYQLKGRTLNSDTIINASDNRLKLDTLKSDIVEVKFNKNDSEDRKLSFYAKVISKQDLENVSSYAISLIDKACKDILQLNITPSPLVLGSEDPCKTCKYFALCRFDENFNNIKRNPNTKIKEENFSLLDQKQEN